MFSNIRRFISMGILVAACAVLASAHQRTILAIGAHAADMDLTAGAILAHQKKLGDRVVILHMTLGEAGNPNMPPAQFAEQKRREALASARGSFDDAEGDLHEVVSGTRDVSFAPAFHCTS